MDSSTAVFSTQGSPFLEASGFQSHYYPSRAQPLSQRERSTALSPSRLQQRTCPASPKEAETSSPPPLSFLPDPSCQGAKRSDSDSSSPYNESWPSTERSSSSLTPEEARALPPEQTSGTKALASPKLRGSIASFSDSESVIARYIERFRYGQPTNRRERGTAGSKSPPFWWLGHSSPLEGDISKTKMSTSSSASRNDADAANACIETDSGQHGERSLSFSPLPDHSPSEESQNSSILDPDTMSLQERAARLLHRSMSPLSSCRLLSSEGLRSASPSTVTNADADVIGQASKPLVGHQLKANLGALSCPIVQISPSHSSLRPEDDILFQWRLRRKMEEASKAVAVLPSVGWRSQCTEPAYRPSMMDTAALKSPEPTSWRRTDRKLLPASGDQQGSTLDGHPCCCRGHWRSGPASQLPTESASFSDQTVKLGRSEPSRKQGVKEPIPREDPVHVDLDFLPPPRPAGATKPLDLSPSDHSQRTAQPVQKVHSEPRGKQRPFLSEQGRPKAARGSAKPSVSPGKDVQRVLGEVVAERLFSPEFPTPQRGKSKKSSKKQGLKGSVPDTVATPSYPELLNVAARLLEQAEDSDGTDFEEDPLLQVLRSQRDLLSRQLRAVDARVAELQGHHSDQDFSYS